MLFHLLFIFQNAYAHISSQQGYISVEGGKIWYQKFYDTKTQENTPLLILHGGPGFPHNYLLSLKDLASKRPVIFYDQLGCGNSTISISSLNDSLWNAAHFTKELESIVQALHLNRFDLLGQSWGGALAIEYTLKHQNKINHLILASPFLSASLWKKDSKRLINQLPKNIKEIIYRSQQNKEVSAALYSKAMQLYYLKHIYLHSPWPKDMQDSLKHMNEQTYRVMWGRSEFSLTGNLSTFERLDSLKKIKIPTLITCGRYDEATPETMYLAIQKLPNGRLEIFEHSGHMSHVEEKNKYKKTIEAFLNTPL